MPTFPPLRFTGARATDYASRHWVDGTALRVLLTQDKDPYLGRLPDPLLAHPRQQRAIESAQAMQVLDGLGQALRRFNLHERRFFGRFSAKKFLLFKNRPTLPTLEITLPSKQKWVLERPKTGCFGSVYRLWSGKASYALKVFFRQVKRGDMGPHAEAALGQYATAQNGTKNLCRFYAANPEPSGQWQLAEYIDETEDMAKRPGIPYEQLGIRFTDGYVTENYINDVRIDYGGWSALSVKLKKLLTDITKLPFRRYKRIGDTPQSRALESEIKNGRVDLLPRYLEMFLSGCSVRILSPN